MDLISSELVGGIFYATDLHSDSQSHVLCCALCVCVCVCVCAHAWVSILARSGQTMWVTLSLLVNVPHSMFGMICQANIHT